jgi:acetolactate synthase-1/3 small subunit
MKKEIYTISIYTENNLGLLNRISAIFLKRHINIESLTVSDSEIEGVSRFIIVVNISKEQIKKIIGQIEKQIEVIKAYYHTNSQSIYLQSALFKVKSSLLFDERQIQNIIKRSNAQIITVSREFFVIEKSGRKEEIEKLYNALLPYGIMQFVRSGRISITKEEMKISELLVKQLN